MAKCLGIVLRSSTAPTAMPILTALRRREPLRRTCAPACKIIKLLPDLSLLEVGAFRDGER
jgi:hypothetical protein